MNVHKQVDNVVPSYGTFASIDSLRTCLLLTDDADGFSGLVREREEGSLYSMRVSRPWW